MLNKACVLIALTFLSGLVFAKAAPNAFRLLNGSSEGKVMDISYKVCDSKQVCSPVNVVTLKSGESKGIASMDSVWGPSLVVLNVSEKKDGKEIATYTSKVDYSGNCGSSSVTILQDYNSKYVVCSDARIGEIEQHSDDNQSQSPATPSPATH